MVKLARAIDARHRLRAPRTHARRVNGNPVSTTAANASWHRHAGSASTSDIGAYSNNITGSWEGYLDGVRLYTRALSNAEVLTIYNAEK